MVQRHSFAVSILLIFSLICCNTVGVFANPSEPPRTGDSASQSDTELENQAVPLESLNEESSAQANEVVRRALEDENRENLVRTLPAGIITRAILMGFTKPFQRTLHAITKRLRLPIDEDYAIDVSAMPFPNAMINPGTRRMTIYPAILMLADSEDELSFVMAHEMTHGNPDLMAAQKEDPKVDEAIGKLPELGGLSAAQREELRADIGAVKRLIIAGYNPWAGYRFMAKLSGLYHQMQQQKKIAAQGFGKASSYLMDHPDPAIRMAAMKAYIVDQMQDIDLSELVKSYKPLSRGMRALKIHQHIYTAPFYSRAFYGVMKYWNYYGVLVFFWQTMNLKGSPWFQAHFNRILGSATHLAPDQTGDLPHDLKIIGINLFNGTLQKIADMPGEFWASPWFKGFAAFIGLVTVGPPTYAAIRALPMIIDKIKVERADHRLRLVAKAELEADWASIMARLNAGQDLPILDLAKLLRDTLGYVSEEQIVRVEIEKSTGTSTDTAVSTETQTTTVTTASTETSTGTEITPTPAPTHRNVAVIKIDDRAKVHPITMAAFRVMEAFAQTASDDQRAAMASLLPEYLGRFVTPDLMRSPENRRTLQNVVRLFNPAGYTPGLNGINLNKLIRDEGDFETKVRILSAAYEQAENLPVPELLHLVRALINQANPENLTARHSWLRLNLQTDFGYFRLASNLFEQGHHRIMEYLLSSQNQDPSLMDDAIVIHNSLIQVFEKAGKLVASDRWEWALLRHRREKMSAGLPAALGTMAFSRAIGTTFSKPKLSIRYWLDLQDERSLLKYLLKNFTTLHAVKEFIDQAIAEQGFRPEVYSAGLSKLILDHPELIQNSQDVDALLGTSYFWKRLDINAISASPLESSLQDSMKLLVKSHPNIWGFEPSNSDLLQKLCLAKLAQWNQSPTNASDRAALWERLTDRGVTATSDTILSELYDKLTKAQQLELGTRYLAEGRIWEPSLKESIFRRIMKTNEAYLRLLTLKPGEERLQALTEVLAETKRTFKEYSIGYTDFLEEISVKILSTPEESALIAKAKKPLIGEKVEDMSSRFISQVVHDILTWKLTDQWEFIRFLRGEIPPTPNIVNAFKNIGYERIKRSFTILPLVARAALIDTMISDPRGLVPNISANRGWGKTIVDHLLRASPPQDQEVARDILGAFFMGAKKSGNEPMRTFVLSYLLAKSGAGEPPRVGEILKELLEGFGTTGKKLGQFLAAAEILPEEDTRILRTLQDNAAKPEREEIYADIRAIHKPEISALKLGAVLGAASVKYAVSMRDPQTGQGEVLKVMRAEAMAKTKMEFIQLGYMAEYLAHKDRRKYGTLKRVILAAKAAVEREISPGHEVEMSEIARTVMYQGRSSDRIEIRAPRERLISRRAIMAEYAPGKSFFAIPTELRPAIARVILKIEADNIFGENPGRPEDVIYFDPDRHPGNYRIFINEGSTPENVSGLISAIDWGQLQKITRAQRDQMVQLVALSQVLARTGSTGWATQKALEIMNQDSNQAPKLAKVLATYFPITGSSVVGTYYSLLSAIEDAGIVLDIAFYDFIRAIVQLNPYSKFLPDGDKIETPGQKLEAAVNAIIPGWTQQMRGSLSTLEKVRFALRRSGSSVGIACAKFLE